MVHINSDDAERRAIRHARFEIVLSLVVESLHRAAQFQSVGGHIQGRSHHPAERRSSPERPARRSTRPGVSHVGASGRLVDVTGAMVASELRSLWTAPSTQLSGRLAGRRDGRDGRIRMRNRCGSAPSIDAERLARGRRDWRDGQDPKRIAVVGAVSRERPARWST